MNINEINEMVKGTPVFIEPKRQKGVPATSMYRENGTWQCWSCARRKGFDIGISADHHPVLFPICSVAMLSMSEVYEVPCSKYESQTGEK